MLLALVLCAGIELDTKTAPVNLLTTSELMQEDERLSDPPTLARPLIAVIVGAAVFLGAGIASTYILAQPRFGRDNIGPSFAGGILGSVSATGLIQLIIGASYLPWVVGTRKNYAERRTEVRARLNALQEGTADSPAPGAAARVSELQYQRPELVLPCAVIMTGTIPLISGIGAYASPPKNPNGTSSLVTGITLLAVGLAIEATGLAWLISRIQTRMEIDDEIRGLSNAPDDSTPPPVPPPEGAALPRVPMQLSFGGRF